MSNMQHVVVDKDGFRPRGTEVSRIDAFSDVVFGFALTLLVVSLEVPRTYDELHTMLLGFLPFAICFWLLIGVWVQHYRVFRRFGLHDAATIRINALLLFVILFYVYPLKFLFSMALGSNNSTVFSRPGQLRDLMTLYGVGFAAISLLIALLNYQGWRHRHALQLTRHEEILTKSYILDASLVATVGLTSCGVAWLLPQRDAGSAGWTYLLIVLHRVIHQWQLRRKLRRLTMTLHDPQSAE